MVAPTNEHRADDDVDGKPRGLPRSAGAARRVQAHRAQTGTHTPAARRPRLKPNTTKKSNRPFHLLAASARAAEREQPDPQRRVARGDAAAGGDCIVPSGSKRGRAVRRRVHLRCRRAGNRSAGRRRRMRAAPSRRASPRRGAPSDAGGRGDANRRRTSRARRRRRTSRRRTTRAAARAAHGAGRASESPGRTRSRRRGRHDEHRASCSWPRRPQAITTATTVPHAAAHASRRAESRAQDRRDAHLRSRSRSGRTRRAS